MPGKLNLHTLSGICLILFFAFLTIFVIIIVIEPAYFSKVDDKYIGFNILENFSVKDRRASDVSNSLKLKYFFHFEPKYSLRKSLNNLQILGSNTVVFTPQVWMHNKRSAAIYFDKNRAQDLKESIQFAKSKGFIVFLRPSIQFLSRESMNNWRGKIRPQNRRSLNPWRDWFRSYEEMSKHYLQIALDSKADFYVVGNELISSLKRIRYWNRLLDELEAVNKKNGKIKFAYDVLYRKEFNTLMDNIENSYQPYIKFFSRLAHLGVNFYYPIANPRYTELREVLISKNMYYQVSEIQRRMSISNQITQKNIPDFHPIPIVISEFGVRSTKDAAQKPWVHPQKWETVDYDEQTLYIKKGLEEFFKHPFIKGVLLWHYSLDPFYGIENFKGREGRDNGERTFAVNGKPVEYLIKNSFYEKRGISYVLKTYHVLFYFYITAALGILIFGLHRLSLLKKIFLLKKNYLKVGYADSLPKITLQIPVYNEPHVVDKVIKSALNLDYPSDKLQIQILDDSTDETALLISKLLSEVNSDFEIQHLKRETREGFKAGALAGGLKIAKGEYIAVFDADFRPPPDFLKSTIKYFSNPKVGLVQAKWGFLNRQESILTQIQALFLEGHFSIEHQARFISNCFFNFNGTAEILRKGGLLDSGHRQGGTLRGDLDLSYRAQLKGWQFIYVDHITADSELPQNIIALKRQQHRWVKGSAQVFKKLLLDIIFSKIKFRTKLEGLFHLSCNFIYLLIFFLALALLPTINMRLNYDWRNFWLIDIPLLAFGSLIMFVFYYKAARSVNGMRKLRNTFFGMILGIGLSINNTIAFIEGLLGIKSEFNRTPKFGNLSREEFRKRRGLFGKLKLNEVMVNILEWVFAVYSLLIVLKVIELHMWSSLPFTLLFFFAFLAVSFLSTLHLLQLHLGDFQIFDGIEKKN